MKSQTFRIRVRQFIFGLSILILIATAKFSAAGDPPIDYSAVQKSLPDKISLEGKVVYVDFWASWCLPCRKSFPWMQSMYDDYHSKGLEIVAVNVDIDHKSATKFLEENQVTFPVVFDSTGDLARLYGLEAMPTSFIYGRDGKLASQHLGFQEEGADDLEGVILELLTRKATK